MIVFPDSKKRLFRYLSKNPVNLSNFMENIIIFIVSVIIESMSAAPRREKALLGREGIPIIELFIVVGTGPCACPGPPRLRRVNLRAADPETGFFNSPEKRVSNAADEGSIEDFSKGPTAFTLTPSPHPMRKPPRLFVPFRPMREIPLPRAARTIPQSVVSGRTAIAGKCVSISTNAGLLKNPSSGDIVAFSRKAAFA